MATQEPVVPLTIGDVLTRVRRRPVLAIAPALLGLAAGAGYAMLAPARYTSSAAVVVQPLVADQFGGVNLSNVINMATEAQVAQSAQVARAAAKRLAAAPEEVRANLTVAAPQGTQVLELTYQAGSAQAAADGAQALAESYLAYREGAVAADADRRLAAIQKQIDDLTARLALRITTQTGPLTDDLRSLLADQRILSGVKATAGGRIITPASVPAGPSSPKLAVDAPIGLVAGGLIGLALALLLPTRRRPPAFAGAGHPDRAGYPALAGAAPERATSYQVVPAAGPSSGSSSASKSVGSVGSPSAAAEVAGADEAGAGGVNLPAVTQRPPMPAQPRGAGPAGNRSGGGRPGRRPGVTPRSMAAPAQAVRSVARGTGAPADGDGAASAGTPTPGIAEPTSPGSAAVPAQSATRDMVTPLDRLLAKQAQERAEAAARSRSRGAELDSNSLRPSPAIDHALTITALEPPQPAGEADSARSAQPGAGRDEAWPFEAAAETDSGPDLEPAPEPDGPQPWYRRSVRH